MSKMLDTLAYCLGLTTNELTPAEKNQSPIFQTKDLENDWTLVDLNDHQCDDYPTPPPSPPVEHSWLITPPPCFNAEVNQPVVELSPLENLLIEHPSIFLRRTVDTLKSTDQPASTSNLIEPASNQENAVEVVALKKCGKSSTCLRRSRRRKAALQSATIWSQQNRRHRSNSSIRRCNHEVVKREHSKIKRMRQIIKQPRKNC